MYDLRAMKISFLASLGLSCVLSGRPVNAQAPSPWADLPLPAGTGGSLETSGKLVLYRDGALLRVYSAVTNRWYPLSLSIGTVPRLASDLLLVPESDRVSAFSAYRGVFEVKMLNWSASTLTFADSVACVVEGAQVHTFSAFTGAWHSRTLPAGWVCEVEDRVVLLRTPTAAPQLAASAFDVYTGQWYDLSPLTSGLRGHGLAASAVIVSSLDQHFAFSPMRPGWLQLAVAGTTEASASGDGTDLVASRGALFSGLTGTFQSFPDQLWGADIRLNRDVAVGYLGSNPSFTGASRNTWTALPAGSMPTLPLIDGGVGLAMVYPTFYAFSPVLGTLTPLPWNNQMWARGAIGTLAWVQVPSQNLTHVFSARTGVWHVTPQGTVQSDIGIARSSALATTATGLSGFSSRTGQWTPTTGAGLVADNGFAARNTTSLRVFDHRTGRWQTEAWQGAGAAAPMFGERTMLAADASRAFGYGLRGARLAAVVLPEPVLQLRVDADVACVRTATHLLAFSGLGDTLTWQGYPDNDFGVGAGTTARMQCRAANGDLIALVFGPPAATPLSWSPFGDVWTDPSASIVFPVVSAPGESRHVTDIAVPNVPLLRGSTWFLQSLTLTSGGAGWFGEPAELVIQ